MDVETKLILILLGGFLLIGGLVALGIKATKNSGAIHAKVGLQNVKRTFKKDPEALLLLEKGNILGFGHYSRKINLLRIKSKTISGVLVVEQERMILLTSQLTAFSSTPVVIPLSYDLIDKEKSKYIPKKKWAVLYLKDNLDEYFLRETEKTDEGFLEKFIQRNGIQEIEK